MKKQRIRRGTLPGEPTPPNIYSDFAWLRENREILFEKYGYGIALIFNKEVIGFGSTDAEAEEDAERNLPANIEQITPISGIIHNEHWLVRVMMKHAIADAFHKLDEERKTNSAE